MLVDREPALRSPHAKPSRHRRPARVGPPVSSSCSSSWPGTTSGDSGYPGLEALLRRSGATALGDDRGRSPRVRHRPRAVAAAAAGVKTRMPWREAERRPAAGRRRPRGLTPAGRPRTWCAGTACGRPCCRARQRGRPRSPGGSGQRDGAAGGSAGFPVLDLHRPLARPRPAEACARQFGGLPSCNAAGSAADRPSVAALGPIQQHHVELRIGMETRRRPAAASNKEASP